MNAYEQIKMLTKLIPDDEHVILQAEKTLWDTFVAIRQQTGFQNFIDALDGKPQPRKEKPSLLAAREAYEQIRELGKRANIDFPPLTTDEEFIEWLIREYALYALLHN